jgi:hypothetical protein
MIGGKCSCLRAKPAHISGHLLPQTTLGLGGILKGGSILTSFEDTLCISIRRASIEREKERTAMSDVNAEPWNRKWSGNEIKDWNTGVIEEFRANGGKVGGPYEG